MQVDLQKNFDTANAELTDLRTRQQEHVSKEQNSPTELSNDVTKEQINVLQKELAGAQQDADALRAAAVINDSVATIRTDEGSPSIAEQIATQVNAIRAELTSRHDERVRQADETFKKRTETMKISLNRRLAEVKLDIRDSLNATHTQALEALRVQHEMELEALRTRHQEELDELRRNDTSKFEQFKQEWRAEHAVLPNGDHANQGDGQPQPPKQPWEPSDADVRALITRNETAKTIIKNNITNKLNQEREALTARVREEQQKLLNEQLAEADKKANVAKDQAVAMEGKRYSVKISMTENRSRAAQAKLDYVQKAATDTPQKPVVEVWTVAKDVKPAPAPTPAPAAQSNAAQSQTPNPFANLTPTGPGNAAVAKSTFGQPTPVQANVSAPFSAPAGPTRSPQRSNSVTTISSASGQPSQSSPTQPIPTVTSEQSNAPNGTPQQQPQQPAQQATQQPSRLPDKPLQPQGVQRNAGTGPAALRGLHSGLPVPSSGRGGLAQSQHAQGTFNQQSQRGGANFGRGRGGIGRGGPSQLQTNNQPASQSQGSPRGGGQLSGSAKQFVPTGTKRPREDGGLEASQHAGDGKRMRGGAQGS